MTKRRRVRPTNAGKRQERDSTVLTQSERVFVLEYHIDGNGTRAYKASHPSCRSDKAAGANAVRLLAKDRVRATLEKLNAKREERLHMEADEALALISLIARADIRDIFDEDGKVLPIHLWPDSIRLAVKSIKPGPSGNAITLYDGLRALELLAIATGKLKGRVDVHQFDHARYLAGSDTPP